MEILERLERLEREDRVQRRAAEPAPHGPRPGRWSGVSTAGTDHAQTAPPAAGGPATTPPVAAPAPAVPPGVPASPPEQSGSSGPNGPSGPPRSERDRITFTISILGASITVIGLVFLAVQAFSRGWLGPGIAVTGAALLCLALGIASVSVHRRHPDGPTAPALLTAAVLGGYTDLWVLVFGLEWLHSAIGIGMGALISIIGLGLAFLWNRQALATTLVIAGATFTTPAALHVLDATGSARFETISLAVLALVGSAATWRRAWRSTEISAGVVFTIAAITLASDGDLLALTLLSLLGIATMTGLSLGAPDLPNWVLAIGRWIPVTVVPVLCLLATGSTWWAPGVTAGVAILIAGATVAVGMGWSALTNTALRPAADVGDAGATVRSLSVATCCAFPTLAVIALARQDSDAPVASMLWILALLAVTSGVILISARLPLAATWTMLGLSVLACLPRVIPAWFPDELSADVTAVTQWPVLLALAVPGVLSLWRAADLGATTDIVSVTAAALGAMVTSAIPLICLSLSDSDGSFMAGHLLMSVMWMATGVAVLLHGNGPAGLAIALAASAKLVFYDLSALSGLIQVAAFVICGGILLASGYLRESGKATNRQQDLNGDRGPRQN